MPLRQTFITYKTAVIALIIAIAFLGFELFNFDTTRYALAHLMRGRAFLGLEWAAILAFAFGSIDLAGLSFASSPLSKTSKMSHSKFGSCSVLG